MEIKDSMETIAKIIDDNHKLLQMADFVHEYPLSEVVVGG